MSTSMILVNEFIKSENSWRPSYCNNQRIEYFTHFCENAIQSIQDSDITRKIFPKLQRQTALTGLS